MAGMWIKTHAKHQCEFPVYHRGNGVKTGDVWLCNDCDTGWSVFVIKCYIPRPAVGGLAQCDRYVWGKV